MAFWNREKRESDVTVDSYLRAILNATEVTVKTAMEVPAVNGCIGFLAGTIAGLPVKLYKTSGKRSEEITDDYRLRLLNDETGDLLDAFQMKCTLVRDYLLAGNGYVFVNWDGTRIKGLHYVDPMYVSAVVGVDPVFKRAVFNINGQDYREFKIMRILRNTQDGVTGSGVVADSPKQLETMLEALNYELHMFKTGSKKGFLKAKGRLSEKAMTSLKEAWASLYSNKSSETVAILNEGLDFQDASQTAVDTQLRENKETNAHEIYRIFNVVPSVMEGDATVEDLKNTVRFGIIPIVRALEAAINRFCLLESEKGTLRFEIDCDALDGTDLLARYQAYEVAVRNGWMQLDEVRYEEGRNPLGLAFVRLGLDTVLYDPSTGDLYTPNTKEWATMRKEGGKAADGSGNQSG